LSSEEKLSGFEDLPSDHNFNFIKMAAHTLWFIPLHTVSFIPSDVTSIASSRVVENINETVAGVVLVTAVSLELERSVGVEEEYQRRGHVSPFRGRRMARVGLVFVPTESMFINDDEYVQHRQITFFSQFFLVEL
jgi:hypothetical protein